MIRKLFIPIFILVMFFSIASEILTSKNSSNQGSGNRGVTAIDHAALMPNWSAIATWPPGTTEEAETIAAVDPWQVTTMIVLDDSGSMEGRMNQAKEAVIQAVSQLDPDSRVGVIALNKGLIADVVSAGDAALTLPDQLKPVVAEGGTPLGSRIDGAARILAQEAVKRRGFGVFRILVTTDGEASDGDRLNRAVTKVLSETPIELATIGIGIGEGHALNVPGFTSYVNVNGVDGLANALAAAAAEQTNFQPIDRFED